MKTCDLCGEKDFNCTELYEHFQTREVKTLCYACAHIVDDFANRMHRVAEKEALKAEAAILKRVSEVERQRRQQVARWWFLDLRTMFRRRVVTQAFAVLQKAPPAAYQVPGARP